MSLKDHLIDRKKSEILKNEYLESNYRTINTSRPYDKPDSRMYTFDLDIMQQYLDLIRDEMEKQGIRKKGIRITMAKYPTADFSDVKPKYAGYQTIVISAADLDAVPENTEGKQGFVEPASLDIPEMNFSTITPPYD